MKHLLALTVMGLLVLPATHAVAQTDPRPRSNIAETLQNAGTFTVLWNAAAATGLIEELKEPDQRVTVLAPSDEAFGRLPQGTVEFLMRPENRNELARLLKNHMLPGQVLAGAFAGQSMTLPSLLGQDLKIDGSGEVKTVNGARITNTDVVASNGVIHIIDQVLVPKT